MATTRIAVLLFCDLVESTSLVTSMGDARAAVIFARHDAGARALLPRSGGIEISRTDGFLLLFERPVQAVEFAFAYLDMLADLSKEMGVNLAARVGIHLGEVVLSENSREQIALGLPRYDVAGLAVPTTARLMSLAGAGQILLSDAACQIAKRGARDSAGLSQVVWKKHGSYLAKGVEQPIEIHEAGIPGRSPLTAPVASEKAWPADGNAAQTRRNNLVRLAIVFCFFAVASLAYLQLRERSDGNRKEALPIPPPPASTVPAVPKASPMPPSSEPARLGPPAGVVPAAKPYGYRIDLKKKTVIFEVSNPAGMKAAKKGWTGDWVIPADIRTMYVGGSFSEWLDVPKFEMKEVSPGQWRCEVPMNDFETNKLYEFKFSVNDLFWVEAPLDAPNQILHGDAPHTYVNLTLVITGN